MDGSLFSQLTARPIPRTALPRAAPLIEPCEFASGSTSDNVNGDLIVWENSRIADPSGRIYAMRRRVGSGNFGQVYEAVLTNADEGAPAAFAVKISRSQPSALSQFEYESQALVFLTTQAASTPLPDLFSYQHSFVFRGHFCIVSALLGPSLLDVLAHHSYRGISLARVLGILRDALTSISFLARLSLVHSDLKPENILFTSDSLTAVRVIDFGSVCVIGDDGVPYAQSRYYRAPEVILGLGLGAAADVWSMGCVAAELMLGLPLFPAVSQLHLLVLIDEMLGPFPRAMAEGSPYFEADGALKSPVVLEQEFDEDFSAFQPYFVHKRLEAIVMNFALPNGAGEDEAASEFATRRAFLDLLRRMLEVDPEMRVSAAEALAHPFFQLRLWSGRLESA